MERGAVRKERDVKKLRRIYEARYRDLRHKVFAHKVAHEPDELAPITAKANINEFKRLISSLLSLHEALFDLFWNGRRSVLRKLRYFQGRTSSPMPISCWASHSPGVP
jgi:hypothetical protein